MYSPMSYGCHRLLYETIVSPISLINSPELVTLLSR